MNKLSVFIITLNEEKHLPGCLESVKWADDIVVVDSFSKDKTTKIAKKYGCRVFKKKFDSFGALKNFALSKTKHNWVLNIDADERIPPELAQEIKEILKNPKSDGYYIPRKSFMGKKWLRFSGQYPSYQLRLFRKDKGKFENVLMHERVIIDGCVGYLKNDMIHHNYENWADFINKNNRLSTLEAMELLKKKHVWFYPYKQIKQFFSQYRTARINGNTFLNSIRIAKNVFNDYEIKPLIPFRPFLTFFRRFVLQQGFRDGMYGLFWCVFTAIHTFIKYAKYYELKYNLSEN